LPPERDESPNIETDEVAISELDFDEQVELSISQLDSIMEGENIAEPIQPLANNANKPDDQKDTLIPPPPIFIRPPPGNHACSAKAGGYCCFPAP